MRTNSKHIRAGGFPPPTSPLGSRPWPRDRNSLSHDAQVAASVHRRWKDLRRAFGGGDHGIAAEVERGEAYLKEEFDRVLADDKIPAETLTVVRRANESVIRGQEQARNLSM